MKSLSTVRSFTGRAGDAIQLAAPLLRELTFAPLAPTRRLRLPGLSGLAAYWFGSNFIATPFMQ
jgi:hypothetical protein